MTGRVGMTDRIRQVMEHVGLDRLGFSRAIGMPNQTKFRQILNEGKIPQPHDLDRILYAFPQISSDWLFDGNGEMLRSDYVPPRPEIKDNRGIGAIGHIIGGVNSFHSNGGKDKVIETQEQQVQRMFEAFMTELRGFREYIERQDDYIRRQDDHLKRIVRNSYLRNERNMQRMDTQFVQQNKLIEMVVEQSKRTQERADLLTELLIKKS